MPYSSDVRWLAVDPGGTSGCVIYSAGIDHDLSVPSMSRTRIWETKQLGPTPHHEELWRLLTDIQPSIVICERFLNQQNAAALMVSLEYVGVIRLYCAMAEKHLVLQNANQAKEFWTDQKLKWLGLYKPNEKHAMDAMRHMLYFLTFTKRVPRYVNLLRIHTNATNTRDDGLGDEGVADPDVVDLPGR
jgi:hypothetical protein